VPRPVRALAALVAALLLLTLSGCGGHDSTGNDSSLQAGLAGQPQSSSPATAAPSPLAPSPSAPSPSAPSPSAPSPSQTPRAQTTTSLFFGDSYIIGGAYTGPQNSMAAIAARRLGWQYQIRGGGGTGFVSGNPDYDIPSFIGQIRQGALDVGPVDWLVIEGGGNDKYDDPGLVTRRAVRTLKAAAKRQPGARLVLVGTMDPTVDGFTDTDGVIGALGAAAKRLGIPYIDAQHWLEGHPELVGPDYDHPTPAGHRLCGRKLARALRALA
jgi:lysophospholipase L1-like esterase